MTERREGWVAKLMERHVVRTAVLYIGGAWIVAQVGDFWIQNYGLNRRYLDVVLFLLTVGLPVALILSWYHGLKGAQKVQRLEAVLLGVLAVIGVVGSVLLVRRAVPDEERGATLLPAATTDLGEGSVAILPLANNTGADTLDWLGTGLADMLTTNFAQLQAVRVVGVERLLDLMRQADAEAADRIPQDLALEIARASGARLMVRGSIAGSGSNLRMDLRLIDLADGTTITGEKATGRDVYALVDSLSTLLSPHVLGGAVQPTELTPVAQLATGNLDAFKEYRAGVRAERRFRYDAAEEHYRRALALDSTFAVAWLRLGLVEFQGDTNLAEATGALTRAERYIEGTSERDRLMIEAMLDFVKFDATSAERTLNQLITKYPDDKEARTWLAILYAQMDRQEDRRRVLEEILRLDPFYAPAYNELSYLAAYRGDTLAADSLSRRYMELEPDQPNPYDTRGEILELLGRAEEGREAFLESVRVDEGFVIGYQHLVRSHLRAGDFAGARSALAAFLGTEDEDASVWIRLLSADTYVAGGDYLEGLDGYARAGARAEGLERADLKLIARLDEGSLAVALGDFERARSAFDEVWQLDAYNQEAFFGSFRALGVEGRLEEMRRIREGVAGSLDQIPDGFRAFADQSLQFADAFIAYYSGDLERAADLFEPGPGFRLQYVFPERVQTLLELDRAEEARRVAPRIAGPEMIRSNTRVLPLVHHQRIYWTARADEAAGNADAAISGYARLQSIAGDGLHLVPRMADTEERLSRLREAAGS